MSNQTFPASTNWDDSTKTALADGDTVTIDTNATVIQNSDTRWGGNR